MAEQYSVEAYLKATDSGFISMFKQAEKAVETFEKNSSNAMLNVGKGMESVGGFMTKYVTAPLVGLTGVAVKVGGDFEEQMSRVQAISGATGGAFDALKDQAIDLGAKTAFSARESAEGMENLASAGFGAQEIMAAMPGLLDLAAVSGGDVALASESAASALRGFGLEASQAGHVADVFARAAADTNAEVTDMGEAMKYIAPVANAMGLSLEETAAAIGIMSDAGIKGSQAGTTLRGALSRIAKPTKAMQGAMDELGIAFYDAEGNMKPLSSQLGMLQEAMAGMTDEQKQNYLVTLYGQEALSGMMTLLEAGPSNLDALTDSLINSDGAANEMARTMQDNMNSSIEQMFGAFESVAIVVQERLAPAISNVANFIGGLAEKFVSASPAVQNLVMGLTGFLIVLGPILLIVGKTLTFIANFKMALAILTPAVTGATGATSLLSAAIGAISWPVVAIVAAIALLVGAFIYLYNTNETVRTAINNVWNAIKNIIHNVVSAISGFVMQIWGTLTAWWTENQKLIMQIVQTVWNVISAVIMGVLNVLAPFITTIWQNIRIAVTTVWEAIKIVVTTVINAILGIIQAIMQIITGDWQGAWETIRGVGETILSGITAYISTVFGGIASIIGNTLQSAYNIIIGWFGNFKNAGANIVNMIASGIRGAIGVVTNAITNVVQTVRNFLPFSPAKTGPLKDLHRLNFGGTIAEGIYNGEAQVERAMESILNVPNFNPALQNAFSSATSSISSDVKAQVNLATVEKQPMSLHIGLGDKSYVAFVEDITEAQNKEIRLEEYYAR